MNTFFIFLLQALFLSAVALFTSASISSPLLFLTELEAKNQQHPPFSENLLLIVNNHGLKVAFVCLISKCQPLTNGPGRKSTTATIYPPSWWTTRAFKQTDYAYGGGGGGGVGFGASSLNANISIADNLSFRVNCHLYDLCIRISWIAYILDNTIGNLIIFQN